MPQGATVWKYLLPIQEECAVEMPAGAIILSVDVDPADRHAPVRHLAVWVAVRPDRPQVRRTFYVRGTGQQLAPALSSQFIGTVVDRSVGLVWHIFDGGPL